MTLNLSFLPASSTLPLPPSTDVTVDSGDGEGARDDDLLGGLDVDLAAGEGARDEDLLWGLEGGREDTLEGGREVFDGPDIEEFLEL